MELGLERKNVLVTGGSRGIGLACARVFLAKGARVAMVERVEAELCPVDILVNSAGAARRAQGGKVPSPVHLAGGAANAALMLASAGLANAYALHGVRVVGLNPGPTDTERVSEGLRAEARRLGITEQEALQRTVARLPLGRLASPEEIADVVAFAASERGRYLTGANISLDGAASPSVV